MFKAFLSFVPFLSAFIILSVVRWRRQRRFDVRYYLLTVIFAVYLILVFHITGICTLRDLLRNGFSLRGWQINLLPFSDKYIVWRSYYQNVLMFMPFGFLLPLLWHKSGGFFKVSAAGLTFSLVIELSQLFNHRSSDVDDLIMNTLGAAAGYALFKLFSVLTKREPGGVKYVRFEPAICIAAIYFGRFFLFN